MLKPLKPNLSLTNPIYVGFNIGGHELGVNLQEKHKTDKVEGVVTYWEVSDIDITSIDL